MLPVTRDLVDLLPDAGLVRGSTVAVCGSTSLLLALLAETSRAGSWVALVGMPTVGVLAAHQLGLVLERVALVPDPGREAATVLAALVDGVDVVVVGRGVAVGEADRRRLMARARDRGAVLVPLTPWAGAQVVLTVEEGRWEGLGRGWGRLVRREVTVRREGRGSAARPVRSRLVLPPPSLSGDTAGVADRAPTGLVTGADVVPFPTRRAG